MTKFKQFFIVAISVLAFSAIFNIDTSAATNQTFTQTDVATHNTETNCWMSFSGSVYDLTNYISLHDKYLEIGPWCGKDMTTDFQSKADMGVDHKASSYSLLELYKIGTISAVAPTSLPASTSTTKVDSEDEEYSIEIEGDVMKTLTIKQIADLWAIDANELLSQIISTYKFKNPYTVDTILGDMRVEYKFSPSQIKDLAEGLKTGDIKPIDIVNLPEDTNSSTENSKTKKDIYNFGPIFFGTIIAYVGSYIFVKSKFGSKYLSLPMFNFFWNTTLVVTLIPSGIFGMYLAIRYQFPALAQINFDFLFWHVEGSIIFATVGFAHLIQRIKQYIFPIKHLIAKNKKK